MQIRHARLDIAEKHLKPEPTDIILSVGCKRGELERTLLPNIKALYAVDIEEPSYDGASLADEGIQFSIADVTKTLPFADHYFDKVLFLEVIEHVPSGLEYKALQEIHRVLKPGGTIVLSTPNKHPVGCAMDPAYWLEGHRHYRPETIVNLLESCGFIIENVQVNGAWREAFLLPVYYLALRVGLKNRSHNWIHRQINREYQPEKQGWYTISIAGTKK